MNPLYVGIDVGSRNNAVYLMKPDGEKHSSFSVENNLGGAKTLTERIVSALASQGLTDVVIGMEATSIYGQTLVYALREDGSLGQFHKKIHVLNPKLVAQFKESYRLLFLSTKTRQSQRRRIGLRWLCFPLKSSHCLR